MDEIGMESAIHEVEADAMHVLLAEKTFFDGPLGGGSDMLLDFEHVLHSSALVVRLGPQFVVSASLPR